MWSYYGSKTNIIDSYPKPMFDKIIEPFAGTARYALKYFEKDVLLIDKYEVIVNIWKYLQQCSIEDIKRLPHFLKGGQRLDDFTFDCQAEKDLIGFLAGFGMQRPRVSASVKRMNMRPNHINYSLNRIAKNLYKIKHWDIRVGSYDDTHNYKATWFVDPPYQVGGQAYVYSNKNIDFNSLSTWCKSRNGQVIVCENIKADWLNFKSMATHKGVSGMQKEVIWTNYHTHYDNVQTHLQLSIV